MYGILEEIVNCNLFLVYPDVRNGLQYCVAKMQMKSETYAKYGQYKYYQSIITGFALRLTTVIAIFVKKRLYSTLFENPNAQTDIWSIFVNYRKKATVTIVHMPQI